MSKEKQIEEMAKAMCGNGMSNGNCATDDDPCHLECVYGCCAEKLYAKGYRKQSEGEWEIVKGSNGKEIMVCTNCRHSQDLHSTFTYCPNCGAKMKGGAE